MPQSSSEKSVNSRLSEVISGRCLNPSSSSPSMYQWYAGGGFPTADNDTVWESPSSISSSLGRSWTIVIGRWLESSECMSAGSAE